MAVVSVTVCDICGTQAGVTKFDIRADSRRYMADLCATDAKAISDLLGKLKPVETVKPKARRVNRASSNPVTLEEIEQLKKLGQ